MDTRDHTIPREAGGDDHLHVLAKAEIPAVVFREPALHGCVQAADEGQTDQPAVGVAAENEIDIPQVVRTVENKRVWHVSKADFRHIGVLKCLEEPILRRGRELLLAAAEIKGVSHGAADAQRLTGYRHVHIAVIDDYGAGFRYLREEICVGLHVCELMVAGRKIHRRDLTKPLYQPQQFLYIRRIRAAVDHVAVQEDRVWGLLLYFGDQTGVILAKGFAVEVGEENDADGGCEIFDRNGVGHGVDAGVGEQN